MTPRRRPQHGVLGVSGRLERRHVTVGDAVGRIADLVDVRCHRVHHILAIVCGTASLHAGYAGRSEHGLTQRCHFRPVPAHGYRMRGPRPRGQETVQIGPGTWRVRVRQDRTARRYAAASVLRAGVPAATMTRMVFETVSIAHGERLCRRLLRMLEQAGWVRSHKYAARPSPMTRCRSGSSAVARPSTQRCRVWLPISRQRARWAPVVKDTDEPNHHDCTRCPRPRAATVSYLKGASVGRHTRGDGLVAVAAPPPTRCRLRSARTQDCLAAC